MHQTYSEGLIANLRDPKMGEILCDFESDLRAMDLSQATTRETRMKYRDRTIVSYERHKQNERIQIGKCCAVIRDISLNRMNSLMKVLLSIQMEPNDAKNSLDSMAFCKILFCHYLLALTSLKCSTIHSLTANIA